METKSIKTKVANTSKYLSDNAKPLLIGGAVVFGLLIFYKIYRNFSQKNKTEEERKKDQRIEGVENLKVNEKKATIKPERAKMYAQQLLDAMDRYGTDEDAILKVFNNLKNGEDYKMVYNAFGLKNYNGFGQPVTGWGRHLDFYEQRNLTYWLQEEIGNDKKVYDKIKGVIREAGFAF